MENEANGLKNSSAVAIHTTDRTLRLELISRNQNGVRHDQGTGMGAEVRNIEYSIAIKIKRGELILPVWDYVAGRLGKGGRCKSNSPKLKLRSQLLFTALILACISMDLNCKANLDGASTPGQNALCDGF